MGVDDVLDPMKTTPFSEEELASLRALRAPPEQDRQVLVVLYHRDGVRVVPLAEGQAVVVGRSSPADVQVRDSSLSRQHASFELINGEVWVEDLNSTNGTRIDGEKVERAKVEASAEVLLGSVLAALQAPGALTRGLASHDQFQVELDAEVARARTFSRGLALLMIRSDRSRKARVNTWYPTLQQLLRPFDRVALYSTECLEVLLPEATDEQARALAASLTERQQAPLLCGYSLFPDHAGSAGELLEQAWAALRRCTSARPVQAAAPDAAGEATGLGPVALSPAMREVLTTVERVASSAIPVLLIGETGTGKEVVARMIHEKGKRRAGPLKCVNCGAIPDQLVESTLFGHERGAFTNASQRAVGVFEAASGGTVLLDEIGELPASAQASLLRVLEEKRVTRVGSTKEIEVDVRVVAATHRDLEEMCRAGTFRQDLLYRLNAMTIKIPPLRERPEEVEPLVRTFVEQANLANERQINGISSAALDLLRRHSWPGNIRELRNAVDRAVVIAQGERIEVEDLPEGIRTLVPAATAPVPRPAAPDEDQEVNLKAELARYETTLIVDALRRCNWDRQEAARQLGLPLRTLAHKVQLYNIKRDEKG